MSHYVVQGEASAIHVDTRDVNAYQEDHTEW